MKVEMINSACVITRETGDPVFRGVVNAAGESRLLYHVKKILNARGYDLIKKRACKDGHLLSDLQQYLRARKPSGVPDKDIYIYNTFWQIEGADERLRREGTVTLCVEKNVFNS